MNKKLNVRAMLSSGVCLFAWLAPLAAQTVSLNASADAYVRSGANQNNNYGNETTLALKKSASPTDDFNREIYLKFNIADVTSVRTAKLRLYGSSTAPEIVTADLYFARSTAWTETGITWANKPAIKDYMWSTIAIQNAPAWHEWDITQFVQAEKAIGRSVITLVVKASVASTTGNITFNSRQAGSNRPSLVIEQAHPWTYYEAEAASSKHASASLDTGTSWGQVAYEARGKKTVTLKEQGHFVTWTGVKAATHVTVRYSIGDGETGSLGVFVNNASTPAATLALNSTRMREAKSGTAAPSSGTVRYFDDVMAAVAVPPNATVRLQKMNDDKVGYVIDFMEVETAPAQPAEMPPGSWVTVVTGTGSDRKAFVDAIAAASLGGKKVWVPAGDFVINPPASGEPNTTGWGIQVPAEIEIRGAGIWHTRITKNYGGDNRRLFTFVGDEVTLADLKCIDTITTLSGNGQNVVVRANDNTGGHVVENVWTEYASLFLGFNVSGCTISGNRVRNAYKDCIHFARVSSNNKIERNTIRNAGDDNVALVAYENEGMVNNTVSYNLGECGYWGRGFTNLGGDGNELSNNLAAYCSRAGILVMTETYSGQTTKYATNWVVEKNTIVSCGNDIPNSNDNHRSGGALCIDAKIDASPMSGRMEYNYVAAPPFNGVVLSQFVGDSGTSNVVYVRYNALEGPAIGSSSTWFRKKTSGLSGNSNCTHTPNSDI